MHKLTGKALDCLVTFVVVHGNIFRDPTLRVAGQVEHSQRVTGKPVSKSSAVMALTLCFAVGILGWSERCGGLTAQASAAEADEIGAAEERQTPTQPVSVDSICSALAAAAAQNDLPSGFFARLIWQESRFNPEAVSRAGAQGVAQFMPATANWRGLSNPFDPLEAIDHSAKLLRDLHREFGNLGLAAAAYNAGSGRVRDWLAGRRTLPEVYALSPTTHPSNGSAGAPASTRSSRKLRVVRLPAWSPVCPHLQLSRRQSGAQNWWEAQPTSLRLPRIDG